VPKRAKPPKRTHDLSVIDRFFTVHSRFLTVLKVAEGRDLSSVKVKSPLSGLIRYNLGDAMELVVGHAERHLRQIEAIQRVSPPIL
jgi:hypothetical protein